MNRWGIPKWLEEEVKVRDTVCIYCGVPMCENVPAGASRKALATWEHIINDARIVTRENIARCCAGCNSSKGVKLLSEWLSSDYCRKKAINQNTVASIVKKALQK